VCKALDHEKILLAIGKACFALCKDDGQLFSCSCDENKTDDRKLYEVCINHKLANHLENIFFSSFPKFKSVYFVDIEFNREGEREKTLLGYGLVRPDIIIHNRKSGEDKDNLLVVECKKDVIDSADTNKLENFLLDRKYEYKYALQVKYTSKGIEVFLFYLDENRTLQNKSINYFL
jgi:hypothetical protein